MAFRKIAAAAIAVGLVGAGGPACAEDGPFGLQLDGSFGEGGFERNRYVPAVTHFVLNETPFITTELRPLYAHHNIPSDFVTGGGNVDAVALQGRLAITDRLGLIATTDGYADVDFNNVLEDADGFLDIAFGLKYALISAPASGQILTAGLRYTAPTGTLNTGAIELTGQGYGYLNPFVTGAKTWDVVQAQGSAGVQIALSDDNWSYVHLGGHMNVRLTPQFFPFIEANALIPIDGGDEFPNNTPVLERLTGGDILDIGAPDPVTVATVAIGARFRMNDNVILGAAIESNVADESKSVFDYRITTDLVVHF